MAQESPQKQLSRKDLRAVAVVAQADERSVLKVLAGASTRGVTAERVRAAMVTLGLAPQSLAQASLPEAR